MTSFKIMGLIHGLNVEVLVECDDPSDIGAIVLMYKNAGMMELPRFVGRDNTPFEEFMGIVESVEETKTKNEKQMFIAHVRPHVKEGEPVKPLVAVKYMPPRNTWRVGDKVTVKKNDKGWLELSEIEGEPPF